MILLIDIGNTSVSLGVCQGDRICFTGSCASDLKKTADEYALTVKGILALHEVTPGDIEGGILSSVVPSLRPVLRDAMERLTGHSFLMVGSGLKTGLNIRTDNPAQTGNDLIVSAVAASARYSRPMVLIGLGTATTLSVIDEKGAYIGGMIVPGLRVSSDALSGRAAQLPEVPLAVPQRVIGKNTVECMQSGALYGCAAMLDGLLDRLEAELGAPCTAVATGSWAELVLPLCKRDIISDPTLRLRGLLILYRKNTGRRR